MMINLVLKTMWIWRKAIQGKTMSSGWKTNQIFMWLRNMRFPLKWSMYIFLCCTKTVLVSWCNTYIKHWAHALQQITQTWSWSNYISLFCDNSTLLCIHLLCNSKSLETHRMRTWQGYCGMGEWMQYPIILWPKWRSALKEKKEKDQFLLIN